MRVPHPLLFALLLLSRVHSADAIFDFVTDSFRTLCFSRYNPFYLLLNLPLLLNGYPGVYETARWFDSSLGTVDLFGTCIRAAISVDDVATLLPTLVERVENGSAAKVNNIGVIRLDGTVFPCGVAGEPTPYANGYCGIALGAPVEDHRKVREMLDIALGSSDENSNVSFDWTDTGNNWNFAGLRAAAVDFLSTRDRLRMGDDAGVFYIQQIHNIVLGIDMSIADARDFQTYSADVLLPASVVPPVPLVSNFFADHAEARDGRARWVELYTTALQSKLTAYKLEASSVNLAAHVLVDAFAYAAAPSINLVTRGVVGAFLNDLDEGTIDWSSTDDLGKMIHEMTRWAPPVLVVPFEADGRRYHSTVGYTGYDTDVYGDDARELRVRGDIAYYRERTMNWADAALPLAGRPETARLCPARSLSYNIVLAFLDAMQIETWEVADGGDPPSVPRTGDGPDFWSSFTIGKIGT